jgi:signal peptidase I
MVNTLLLVVAAVTLLIWLVQEIIARRAYEHRVAESLRRGATLTLEDLAREPLWSDWLFRLVVVAWLGWGVSVLLLKDGDFALVLVVLTLLSGVIAGLDQFWFLRRRQRFVGTDPVASYLTRFSAEQAEEARREITFERMIAEYGRSFFPVLAVVLVLRSFVVEPFQIPSSSMVPTLEIGDYILVNKFSYGLRLPVAKTKVLEIGEPQRGDVVVFFPPNDNRYFIKRLIGLPGDRISYRNKQLTVNGVPVEQTLLAELPVRNPSEQLIEENLLGTSHLVRKEIYMSSREFDEIVVEPGHYFMMGDNRDNSQDSRYWGQVPEANLVGKAFAVWMHWASLRELPSFSHVGAIR